jgi:hypothetical protein
MLQVWLDDSGKGQDPAFVLAGYFSSVESWVDFSDEWKDLLHKPPHPLAYLKGYEAFGLRDEFMRWNVPDRDARVLEFVPLIVRHSNRGIAFVINHAAFDSIVRTAPETPFKDPYIMAYFMSLSTILPIVQESFPTEKIDIVFDRNLVSRRQAEAAYDALFRLAPDLGALLARREPRFEDDKVFMPLQAADLLAHCVRAHFDPEPKYDRVRNSPVFTALRNITTALVEIDEVQMQSWRDHVEGKAPRASQPKVTKW